MGVAYGLPTPGPEYRDKYRTAGTLKVYFHGEWLNLKSGENS